MTRSPFFAFPVRATVLKAAVCGAVFGLPMAAALAATFPITPEQRSTAQEVAQAGVPLSELAPNAPDTYTVKKGDTLWDISGLYLKRPWRWPELWGMNLEQIRNPHLIYPGQMLFLEKIDGRARLRMGRAVGGSVEVERLSPQVRSGPVNAALSSVNLSWIEPFLNEAVIFDTDALLRAPKIVAGTEDQVLLSQGNLAYAVGGEFGPETEYRIFREPRALRDPTTNEVLGFEAAFLGTADFLRPGETRDLGSGRTEVIPATLRVTSARREIGVGDRLSPVPPRQFVNYVPHAPQAPTVGPDRVDLRRRADSRQGPDRVAQSWRARRRATRLRARTVARRPIAAVERIQQDPGPTSRRARRHAVRVPRLRPHVLRADRLGVGAGSTRRPFHAALIARPDPA